MAYQGRGSKTGAKIVAKSVKAQGGRANAAKNAVTTAAKAAAFAYNPNKVGKVVGIAKKASKAVKGAQASKVPAALPSKIVTKGATYSVSKTPTGKVKLTTSTGNTVTFPKGTSAQKIATRMQEGQKLFGDGMGKKSISTSLRGKIGRAK